MFDFCSLTIPSSKKAWNFLFYNSQIHCFIVMDAGKLLSLGMDAISCVQCCSLLADNTNHLPRLLVFWSPVLFPPLCLQPRYRHVSLLQPPQLDTSFLWHHAPTLGAWPKGFFMLHPRSWSSMKAQVKTKLHAFAVNSKISYRGGCWGKPQVIVMR